MSDKNLVMGEFEELTEEEIDQIVKQAEQLTDEELAAIVAEEENESETAVVSPDDDLIMAEDTVIEVPVCAEGQAKTEPRKKKKIFWKALSICFAVTMVLTAVGLWFFYKQLERYEASTPGAALNNYVTWVQEENYEAIYKASDFEESILNTKAEYIRYLSRIYAGDTSTLVVREKVTSTETEKHYSLYIENKRVGGLTLIKNPEWGETAWSYVTEIVPQPTTTVYASDEVAKITVNGVDLSILNLPAESVQETLLGGVEDDKVLPNVFCYKLEGLLNPPLVEGWSMSGSACVVTVKDDTAYHLTCPAADSLRTEREEQAKDVAFTYAKFVARDAGSGAILKHVYKDSDLYTTIQNFSNYWFTGHSSYRFEDVKITDYTQYTAKDFACNVYFQPIYTHKGKTIKTAPFQCRLTFVEIDEEWKLVSLVNIIMPTDSEEEAANDTK